MSKVLSSLVLPFRDKRGKIMRKKIPRIPGQTYNVQKSVFVQSQLIWHRQSDSEGICQTQWPPSI